MKLKLSSDLIKSVSLLILIVLIIPFGFYLNRPPKAVPGDAPLEEFSAVRAMKHLEHIASKPHSIGTDEHIKVRNYIIDELKKVGTKPELQIAELYYPDSYIAATVGNIIVKLPGTETGKAVLIMGHYDSVVDSYGASDDGSAIITMLETLRLLQLKKPFKNDIIFLFTDGEEVGLLGAKAFIDNHPFAEDVGIVLNFESSGTSGQSLMFETSTDNNWIISEFAKAVPYPAANSLSYEIYRNMPNDTDLTPFKNAGYKGFNFAYIESRFDYHTLGDNISNTSVESIQHHGSYAVALIQHFGNIDLNNSEKGNAVYFNTIGSWFVHYSYRLIIPFLILTCLCLIFILFIGFRKKIIRPLRSLFGFFAFIIHLAIAPLIVTLIYFILIKYFPDNDFRLLFYNQKVLLLGFVLISASISFGFYKLLISGIKIRHVIVFFALVLILLIWSGLISLITVSASLAISVIIYFLYRKPTNVWELSVGSVFSWAIIMVIIGLMMPGASYLFTWPLIFSLIPIGIYFFNKNRTGYSVIQIGLFLIFALPALLWFSNITLLFLVAMGLKMAGGAILFTVLCLSLLVVHIEIIAKVKAWFVPVVAFALGLFFLLYGSIGAEYSETHKKQNSLIYGTDGNTGENFLTSYDHQTDEWTVNFLTDQPDTSNLNDFFSFSERDFLKKSVDLKPLAAPSLEILHDSVSEDRRQLKLHIASGRKADNLFIQIRSNSDLMKASINKSRMKDLQRVNGTDWYLIKYFAFPDEGIDITLNLDNKQEIEIHLIDFVYGLPDLLEVQKYPRPSNMMSNGDRTIATKNFVL